MKSFFTLFLKGLFVFYGTKRLLSFLLLFLVLSVSNSYGNCNTCTNNLVTNPGFESDVNNWNHFNGNFYRNTSFSQCSTTGHAEFERTSGSWGGFYQDINVGTGGMTNGSTIQLTFWAGVHDANANTLFGIEYFNGTTYVSETTVQIDKILGGSPSMQFYTVNSVVPAGVNRVRVIAKADWGYIKVDEVCLRTITCDPNNTSAPPFCAPTPNCPAGSFLWSQPINSTDGSSSLRLVCGSTTSYTIPGPYPSNFGSGAVTFTISDVVSYDGYSGRNTVTQANERWRLVFKKNGVTVATSGYTNDVPDLRTQGYWRGSLGTVTVPNGVDQILIEHWSVANDGSCSNGPNSVGPTSVCISATTTTCNPDNSSAPPFCAPTPNCPAGSFLWSQPINSTDGSSSLRLVCGSTTSYTIPGPYPSNFASGALTFNISDVVSYDGYSGRNTVTQANERWRLVFKKNGVTVATSGYTNDVPDLRTQGYWRGSLGTVTVPNGVDQILIEHWSVANDGSCSNGPNSVGPTSVCISAAPNNPCLNFTALAQSNTNLIKTRQVSNEFHCSDNLNRVFYANCLSNNDSDFYKIVSGGEFKEYCDGTASLEMVVESINNTNQRFSINVVYSGRTFTAPAGSPHVEGCTSSTSSNWYYYTSMRGTMVGLNDYAGAVISFREKMSAFQLGSNASLYQASNGQFGASGWLDYTIISQPTNTTFNSDCQLDFNFYLSGGDLTPTQASACNVSCPGQTVNLTALTGGGKPNYTYSWSNNLGTGQNKTVNPNSTTTYTVTITDANNCTAVDQVTVTVNPQLTLTIPNDEVCAGGNYTKTVQATGGTPGYTYNWSNNLGSGNQKSIPAQNGSYTVTVTDSKGCTAVGSFTVTAGSFSATASNDGPLTCLKTTVTMTANPSGMTYSWSGGGTARTKNVTTPGTYTVTVTNTTSGCTAVATTTVSQNITVPVATASNDGPLTCTKTSVTLTATGGGTYAWSGGGTAATKSVTATGTYTVTVTNTTSGCTAVATTTVTGDTNVPTATANNDGPLTCTKTSVTLTATGGGTYAWSGGGTAATKSVTAPGTYTVTVTNTTSGCTAVATTTVSQNITVPVATANNDGPLTCTKTSVTLTATGGGTYAWSGGGTAATKSVTATGTYTVTVTNTTSGCTAVATTTVSQDVTVPTATANNDGPLTCTKTNVTLTATGGGTYAWSGGGTAATKSVTSSGTYTVTVTSSNGCTSVATTTVSQNITVPVATANNDGPLTCTKTSVTLTATGGGTYAWSGGGTAATKSVTAPGTYTVTVTNTTSGCTAVATTTVAQNITVPVATANNDGPLTCTKTSVTLTATGGGTYAWSGGGTAATKSVTAPGTYTVTVTNTTSGCTAVATTTVAQNITVPSATANNDGQLTCTKTSVTLTATGGGTYAWSGGGTAATKSVTAPGTYTVTVTNTTSGCTALATTTVSQDVTVPTATADNIGGPLTCVTTSVTIRAFPNDASLNYNWSGPAGYAATSRTNIVSTPGAYTVTVTNPTNGCSATATTTVNQDITTPTGSASNDGPLSCAKTIVTMTANPATGVTYAWSGGGNLRTKAVTTAGTYTVTVTSTTNGCTAVATTTVTGDTSTPNSSASNDGPLTCLKTSVTLTANPATGVTYLWSGGGTNRTKIVTTAGTYTVTVTNNSNGCTSLATTTVSENKSVPNASADNIGGPLTCIDNSVTIRAFPNVTTYTYAWSGPSGYTATSRENNVSIAGTYRVTVTDTQNGCTASSSTNVTQDTDIPTANAGGNKTICNGTSTTLTATGNGTYRWSTNATTASITVNPVITTTYTVTVTGANGCTNSAQAIVTVTPLPSSGLTGPNEICVDEYAVFNASPVVSGATYAWTFDGGTSLDGDANDPTESIKWASTYQNTSRTVTLTVTKDNCSNTYTKAILVKAGVYLNTQANYPVCEGGTVQIGPNPNDANQVSPGATFQWTPNLFLNSNTVARPLSTPPFDIVYTLTATLNGCAVSRQITVDVNVNLNPIADAGQDKTVCLGNSVQIGGTPTATPPAGATISGVIWTVPPSSTISSTQQNPLVSPTSNTQYRVVVVASTGCTDTDFVNVVVQPKAKIGNFVWRDDNANGVQDTNEPGLGSVPVKLFNTSNVEVGSTNTNAQGFYEFEVCAGTYYVEFGAVTGYSRTIANTSDDTKDSDANVTNGRTQNYTLNPGDNNPTVDAGYVPNGKIGDFVWEDKNGNGQQDSGELGISGVTVQLLDQNNNVIRTTTTSSTGAYEFDNLPPGTYYVRVTPPTGYSVTTPNSGNDNTDSDILVGSNTTGAINLGAGQTNLTIDAGLLRPASLGDYVWEDRNGNGVQDSGEPGISGVTVMLEDASGNPARDINNNIITATTTGANGQYQFTNLKPGVVYVVKFTTPSGYQPSSADRGGDDTKDSDANTSTGKTPGVTLESGQNNPTIDAGYYKPASLGDFVWDDTNGNGRQDAGEPGISGLTVTLTGTAGDGTTVNLTTSTGPDGSYSFTNLKPGTYTVTFTKPTGTAFTGQDNGTDDKDSDASPTTGSTTAITLVSGQNNTTVDAGVTRPASLGDFVWDDRNGNGVQDTGEPGISGVTVSLEDATGNPARDINNNIIPATTTGTNGQYQFTNLKPGVVYVVKFTAPTGYQPSSADRGADDTKDSDANVTTGKAAGVTLTGGQNNPTIDAGYYRPATIGDFVWEDKNGNGIQDAGEPGIAGVTVTLTGTKGDGTPITPITVTTGTNGSYQFTNLAPGTYTVTFTKPANTVTTTPDQGGDDTKDSDASITTGAAAPVTVQSGETNNTIDAGYLKSASLGDYVWEDSNANGVQDSGEPGIAGVTVRLEDAAGNQARDINNILVPNATTGTNGQYQFTNLRPGVVYVVNFIAPNGYTTTSRDSGSDDTKDSDASTTTGKSQQVTLSSGENNPTIDAGYYRRASLGDFVWHDLNANGVQDAGEPGIGGVTVRLFNSSGMQEAFTVTAANGSYSFTGLTPGSYSVKFDTPNGYIVTPRDMGGNDTKDSDANPVTGLSPVVNLAGGDNNTTIDAGYYKLAQIGNFVWEDRNANGVQDAFEPGIEGVTVNLTGTDVFGVPVNKTTTTDASGLYEFTNLVPGTYTVTFVRPGSAYKSSPSNSSPDDAADSDADPVSGSAAPELLVSGEDNRTIDAGFYRCSNVGDYVWVDQGGIKDVQDAGDVGMSGVKVELYSTNNPSVPVQTMFTKQNPNDATKNGYYNFEICQLGTYFIKVHKPENYDFVTPNQGSDDAKDSDVIDFPNQTTLLFTVGYAVTITDIDAGIKSKALPVILKDFTGRWNQTDDVNELAWTTMTEVNNDYFEIERSVNKGDFEVVGRVKGKGNSTEINVYKLTDREISRNGDYVYRLRQVDHDGNESMYGPLCDKSRKRQYR
jgi:protocatechuate 3,4-dioxygenase beta subunit